MVKPVVWKCILEETGDTVTHWQSHHGAAYKVPWDHFPGFQMMGTGISTWHTPSRTPQLSVVMVWQSTFCLGNEIDRGSTIGSIRADGIVYRLYLLLV